MSADRNSEVSEQIPDLGELLARMAMPSTPREALEIAPEMLRHLRRVEFVRANAGLLVKKFKLPGVPRVCGVLVVNGPQPMQQLQGEYSSDATVVMLDRIGSVPWATGWRGWEKQRTS